MPEYRFLIRKVGHHCNSVTKFGDENEDRPRIEYLATTGESQERRIPSSQRSKSLPLSVS